jgi:predicted nuclease with RNAse H fold
MLFSNASFIGVDPTAGRKPFTFAALDANCRLLALETGELEEVLAFVGGQQAATVAVNAPSTPNRGLVKKRLEAQSLTPSHPRGDMRVAEYELRRRGILVSPTPGRIESCAEWMQLGFMLYHKLASMGCAQYPAEAAAHQWLETHPHAAFCALLEQSPLSKPSLEGRLQRQLILYERGVGIRDPMDFFDEITRHRLVKGILPVEMVYTPEQLDAIVAAYTAFAAGKTPEEVLSVGEREEGRIVLPVRELKERY